MLCFLNINKHSYKYVNKQLTFMQIYKQTADAVLLKYKQKFIQICKQTADAVLLKYKQKFIQICKQIVNIQANM